jgi:two-component system OmpR family sensor kinase
MKRLPITIRLTVIFAAVMAAVLAGTGLFLHARLGSELDHTLEEGLESRADDVAAVVRRDGARSLNARGSGGLTDPDESVVQVIDSRGVVVAGTRTVRDRPLVRRAELDEARNDTVHVERRHLPGEEGAPPLRLLATPARSGRRPLVIVVGASLEERDEALSSLAAQMLIGGPIALLLASLTAFGVAHASLRPVELMRRRAGAISGSDPGERLPVPSTRDELARLGETLNAMLARLEASLARERNFVSDASHELRMPLAILKAELELALRDGRSRKELQEAVESAAQETDRLVQLAEDLLVIARSDQGRLPVRHEVVVVDDLLDAVRRRFALRAEQAGRELVAETAPSVTVQADKLRLEQALGNLVDNALRHGGGPVRLRAVEADGRVDVHVVDDGPGFPPTFIERAFERFSRADEARARGGSGLGLAVVEGIAVAHGGSAHAANRAGGGADVWVSLPADAAAANAAPARAEGAQATPAPAAARVPTRLVLVLAPLAAAAAVTFAVVGVGNPDGRDRLARMVPVGETQPVPHGGDAADDPAIWVDRRRPGRSAVIGTDKDGGIAVYDLAGRQLQYLRDGELNNVDLRSGFAIGGRRITLVAASNRTDDTIAMYRFDEGTRTLSRLGSIRAGIGVYGLCMYRSPATRAFHVFVDSEQGEVEQWRLAARGNSVTGRRVRSFDVGSQVEGCVADDALRRLYVAEEARGIWRYGAEAAAGTTRSRVDSTGGSGHLVADVEGLAIARGRRGSGFLVASSQGDNAFAVYRRSGRNGFVRKFEISSGARADGAEDTDGIEVTAIRLSDRFPHGLLVAQDGDNDGGNQNFKLVPWRPPPD